VFESSSPFAPFDYFRVPYTVTAAAADSLPAGWGRLRADLGAAGAGASLFWPTAPGRKAWTGLFRVGGSTLGGHVVRQAPHGMVPGRGGDWRPVEEVRDRAGAHVAWVWKHSDGDVWLPFDPGEAMRCLWSEEYTALGARAKTLRSARALALRGYYALRPLLPRPAQLRMRRALARHQQQENSAFPAWPVEDSLHGMYSWLFDVVAGLTGEPVPSIAPWPDGFSWALVLTHDVETQQGVDDMELLRRDERRLGYRSSWNFVPERYDVTAELLERTRADGCEVGVHGLRHDGRDLASRRQLLRRLPAIRRYAESWGAVGFRSPATQRAWALMPLLGFEYDASYTDTDPYEPQPGGCCTYLPFFIDDLVELPITVPQDHTLFEILLETDTGTWLRKAVALRDRGGLALVLAHPDYARNSHMARAWQSLLEGLADDPTMWQPLARDAASWWRDRAASELERDDDGWTVRGPAAARAGVRLLGDPSSSRAAARVSQAG
jgi:hypothetical protein